MESISPAQNLTRETLPSSATSFAPVAIALIIATAHLLTNHLYGLHRDELQVLSDARHLDWGFVAYPPFTPFIERVATSIFGLWLVGLRLFSVIAQAIVVVVAGLIARELGGGRLAQFGGALAVALAPLTLFEGTEFQYTTFDYLWWVLIAYFVVRLLKSEDPRWCLAIGATIGVGLMTKYTMIFYVAGILAGLLFTSARRFFLSRWFWAGIGLALLIFLPNLIWQLHHDLISLHFLQSIHARDVGQGRANGFLRDQLMICTNPVAAPLWIAGLVGLLRSSRFRMLAFMYLVPFLVLWLSKGRGYYPGAAYPMLIAMGAVLAERWLTSLRPVWRKSLAATYFTLLIAAGLYAASIILPTTTLRDWALKNNGDLREEIGWNELVKTVADIRDSLPPQQRQNLGILAGNYGEQGAVEILGPAYHLPVPISGVNSAWLRGYPTPPPTILIILGRTQQQVDRRFTSCRLAGHVTNSLGIHNEESDDHPDIFVCGPPKLPWPEFWQQYQGFG